MLYHWDTRHDLPFSPFSLQTTFRITEKRFVYTQLLVKARLQDWNAVKQMVIHKGLFSESIESPIGLIPFVEVTVKYHGPIKLIEFFVASISNLDDKLDICIKYGLWSLAVQVISLYTTQYTYTIHTHSNALPYSQLSLFN
jgi:hypothetical protein